MYDQLVHSLNNSIGVIDISYEKEKLAAFKVWMKLLPYVIQ